MTAIAVTAWGIHVPGWHGVDADESSAPACSADRAHELLGRQGLLGKEPATRLALCAVHRALGRPAGAPRPRDPIDPRAAVVGSSNFGNIRAVQQIVRAVGAGGLRDVSALDAPNASSNVLASTVAIWFRCGGPNLMVCSGATSGLDAIALAMLLLRSGRADRAIVVGAEPDDDVAAAWHRRRAGRSAQVDVPLRAAAAAVVLEPVSVGDVNAIGLAPIWRGANHPLRAELSARPPIGSSMAESAAGNVLDLATLIGGDAYGAAGILQVALAASRLSTCPPHDRPPIGIVCGDEADGWRSTFVGDVRSVGHDVQTAQEVAL